MRCLWERRNMALTVNRTGSRVRVTRFRWVGRKTRRKLFDGNSVEIDVLTREMVATRVVALLTVSCEREESQSMT